MASRELVGQYLNTKRGFILVSHDRYFLDQCVDHILSISNTDIEVQRGNYTSWAENKERQDQYELGGNEKLKKEIAKKTAADRRTPGRMVRRCGENKERREPKACGRSEARPRLCGA